MFAVKDFWKFQGANKDDIEMKYQTSEQRRNFQKDSQPNWVAAAQADLLCCSSVADLTNMLPPRASQLCLWRSQQT